MGIGAETQTTKAAEWVVGKLTAASTKEWVTDKLQNLTSSTPAFLSRSGNIKEDSAAGSGGSSADVDAARADAAKARAVAEALEARLVKLEEDMAKLQKGFVTFTSGRRH